jgi:hypothetical protein
MWESILGLASGLAAITVLILRLLLKAKSPEEIAQEAVNRGDQAVSDLEQRKLDEVRNFIKVEVEKHVP